jgi:hypothetical protein
MKAYIGKISMDQALSNDFSMYAANASFSYEKRKRGGISTLPVLGEPFIY